VLLAHLQPLAVACLRAKGILRQVSSQSPLLLLLLLLWLLLPCVHLLHSCRLVPHRLTCIRSVHLHRVRIMVYFTRRRLLLAAWLLLLRARLLLLQLVLQLLRPGILVSFRQSWLHLHVLGVEPLLTRPCCWARRRFPYQWQL
jgi:hypothetical protein